MITLGPDGSATVYEVFIDSRDRVPSSGDDGEDDYQGIFYGDPPHSQPPYPGFAQTSTLKTSSGFAASNWYFGAPYDPVNTSAGAAKVSYITYGSYENNGTKTGLRGRVIRPTSDGWTIGYWTKNNTTGALTYSGTYTYTGSYSANIDLWDGTLFPGYWADFQYSSPLGTHGYMRMQDGLLNSSHPAWSDPNHPSWQYVYEGGVTNPHYGYDTHLVNGVAGVASIAKFEPYNIMWRTPGHKWPDVFFGTAVNVWGDKGGLFWRMSADRKSYFLADRVGVHFVENGVKDTIHAWLHPKQPGDWIECSAVGGYLNPYSRDQALGGPNSFENVELTDYRNVDCTIHGILDFADATVRTSFTYYDLSQTDAYGDDVIVTKIDVDADGKITAYPRFDCSPPNGAQGTYGYSTVKGPGDDVTVLVMEEENSFADNLWAKVHAYTITSDGSVKHSVVTDSTLGTGGDFRVIAAGESFHQPVLITSYAHYPSNYYLYTLWLDETYVNVVRHPREFTAGLRKPPSQRNPEFGTHRQKRAIQSMTPGSLGGLITNASPTRRSERSVVPTTPDSVIVATHDITFRAPGPLVTGAASALYRVASEHLLVSRLTISLGTIATTSTTVTVESNGVTFKTATIAAGQYTASVDLIQQFVAGDVIRAVIIAAGSGASDLTVQLRTT